MSIDTYLYIDKKFKVWDCIASCVCQHKKHCLTCQKHRVIVQGKNLEQAIRLADKYDYENPLDVEYGSHLRLWCK